MHPWLCRNENKINKRETRVYLILFYALEFSAFVYFLEFTVQQIPLDLGLKEYMNTK